MKDNKKEDKDIYFAKLSENELLDALHSRIENYYDFLETTGIYDLCKRAYVAYYGGDLNRCSNIFQAAKLTKDGKAGQITKVKINNYRNLVKHAITLATANKTSLTCVATNTDQKSMAQVTLADSLLDYYLEESKVGFKIRGAVEYGCLMGEGWVHMPWEPKAGEIYEIDENKDPVYEGDLDVTYHHLFDVVRDVNQRNTIFPWLMIKKMVNKYELAAQYNKTPDVSEEDILNLSNHESSYDTSSAFRFELLRSETENQNDLVPVWTFYHSKTEAMPKGKITIFSGDVTFFSGDLPYDKIPLIPIMPDLLHESAFGYSPFNDLLGPQQAHDNLMSTALTNNLTHGLQFLWVDQNEDDLDVSTLEDGLKLIKSKVKPEALQLTQSSPELYKLIQQLDSYQEQLAGISSTIRGKPESNIQSGTAMALVVAQSVQFGSQLEESHNACTVECGETIIAHLQSFAKTPRLAFIVGENKRPYMEQFTGEDISDIKRIAVQQVSALSKTISGRVDLAEKIMQLPQDKVAAYMSVVNTGQLPPEYQTTNPVQNIRAENERLAKGEEVQVIFTENHKNHIKEHKDLIENPISKQDPQLVAAASKHIQEHIRLWRETDPIILMATGQEPPPQNPATQAPLPGAIEGQQAPASQGPTAQAGPEQASLPDLPGLPQNADDNSKAAYAKQTGVLK